MASIGSESGYRSLGLAFVVFGSPSVTDFARSKEFDGVERPVQLW